MHRKILSPILIATGICGGISAYRLISLLFSDYLYQKDFVQFYLMGHALRAGGNLYAPLPDLAAQFDPNLDHWLLISAYPPIAAVIGFPFSFLPYFWSVVAWMILELACLTLAIILIIRQFGGRSASISVLIMICVFTAWHPVYVDLYLGQLMIPILLLLTLTWLALRTQQDVKAGLLLGVVLTVKLYAWPLALFCLLKGRWRVVAAAGSLFIALNAVMAIWVGSGTTLDYYLRVGGAVLAQYVYDPFNFSSWSIGYRAFGTTGGIAISLLVLSLSLLFALRMDFEVGFMMMLAAATILQPISWIHYMITLLPAFCFIANRQRFRTAELIFGVFLIVLILPGFYIVAHSFAPMATWPPFLFIIGLMWLIVPKAVLERSAVTKLDRARETA
jgi:hypothetical protein